MARHRKRYSPPGTPPGTLLAHTGATPLTFCLVEYDATHYEYHPQLEAAAARPYLDTPTLTWLHGQGEGGPEQMRALGNSFGLHPLAMEDVLNSGQRPKAERYDGQLFVILSLPRMTGDTLAIDQVSLFLGPCFVVSFASSPHDPFTAVRARLGLAADRLRRQGADALLHALLDVVIDQGFPVLEAYGERIEALEQTLLSGCAKQAEFTAIHILQRDLLQLRRALWPTRELLSTLIRDAHPLLGAVIMPYLRDSYDHAVQVLDWLETARETLAHLSDLYLQTQNLTLTEVMRTLTVISILFMPPTFLVGVYGMNFDTRWPWNMPELGWPYGYLAVWGLILAVMVGMLLYFKRKRWF